MVIIRGIDSADEISIGDVIVFDAPGLPLPVVHRVIDRYRENGEWRFTTKGDRNPEPMMFERSIWLEQIRGKVIYVIPKIGYLSLWWKDLLS
jgi:signal peptidase I